MRLSCEILLEIQDPGNAVAGVSTWTRDGCTFAQTEEGTMRSSRVVAGAVVAVACVLLWSPAWAQHEEAEAKALEAAKAWLALVDSGKNAESWYATTSFFRYTVPREKWDARLVNGRRPLGNVKSRTLFENKYVTDLPDSPIGEYVVIKFRTVFENMPKGEKEKIEIIAPMLQKDGTWKVSGYSIKQPGQ
jgi:metal-sulfur cluster biosynthetic enzyme